MKTTEEIWREVQDDWVRNKHTTNKKWLEEQKVKEFITFVEKYCDIDVSESEYFKNKRKLGI